MPHYFPRIWSNFASAKFRNIHFLLLLFFFVFCSSRWSKLLFDRISWTFAVLVTTAKAWFSLRICHTPNIRVQNWHKKCGFHVRFCGGRKSTVMHWLSLPPELLYAVSCITKTENPEVHKFHIQKDSNRHVRLHFLHNFQVIHRSTEHAWEDLAHLENAQTPHKFENT